MSTQPAPLSRPEKQEGVTLSGHERPQEGLNPATLGAILKLTKTKELFFHFEIGFKRTTPKYLSRTTEVQAPQGEAVVPQSVLAFSAAPPRQAPTLLADGAAPQGVAGGSDPATSGSAGYVRLSAGITSTPPDGYPPKPPV
jgi:hypothetical protein